MNDNNHSDLPIKEIRAYCLNEPIERLSEFAPEFDRWLRQDTDVGLLVEYQPDAKIGYLDMARHEIDIGAFLNRRVDLRTPNEIDERILPDLKTSARLPYETER